MWEDINHNSGVDAACNEAIKMGEAAVNPILSQLGGFSPATVGPFSEFCLINTFTPPTREPISLIPDNSADSGQKTLTAAALNPKTRAVSANQIIFAKERHHETHLPAECPRSQAPSRFPVTYGNCWRPPCSARAPGKGPFAPVGLIFG